MLDEWICWPVISQATKLYFSPESMLPVTDFVDNPPRDSFTKQHQRSSACYYHSVDNAVLGRCIKGKPTLVLFSVLMHWKW